MLNELDRSLSELDRVRSGPGENEGAGTSGIARRLFVCFLLTRASVNEFYELKTANLRSTRKIAWPRWLAPKNRLRGRRRGFRCRTLDRCRAFHVYSEKPLQSLFWP